VYRAAIAHDAEVKAVLRAYSQALSALQRLDRARRAFRSTLLDAHEAGASKAELARALGVSRQRVDEVLRRARHERAAGVEDVTD
jgi:DNA-directed RNA polymerase specialized sigma24 family protein